MASEVGLVALCRFRCNGSASSIVDAEAINLIFQIRGTACAAIAFKQLIGVAAASASEEQ